MLFLLFLIMSGAAATAQVHDVYYQGNLTPRNTTPTFDHGYLVVYNRDHRIDVFALDGAPSRRPAVPAVVGLPCLTALEANPVFRYRRIFTDTGRIRSGPFDLDPWMARRRYHGLANFDSASCTRSDNRSSPP